MHAAYAENDFESYSSFFCDDIVYEVHIDKCVSACGGRTIGKDALYWRYSLVLKNFEKLVYRCLSVSVDGVEASSRIDYYYIHKASGEVLSGRLRHVVQLRGELIERVDVFHDKGRVEAFFQMVRAEARHY